MCIRDSFSDETYSSENDFVAKLKTDTPKVFPKKPHFEELRNKILAYQESTRYKPLLRTALNSVTFSLVLSLVCILLIFKLPITGFICLIVSFRVVIIFLTSPGNHFDYFYSQLIFGYFLPFLIFIEFMTIKTSGRLNIFCLLYTSPSPRDATLSRMPSSA